MAMFDWNGNGKKDFADDYIEYQIYKDCTEDDDEEDFSGNTSGSGLGCGFWFWVVVVIFIIGLISNFD